MKGNLIAGFEIKELRTKNQEPETKNRQGAGVKFRGILAAFRYLCSRLKLQVGLLNVFC